MKKRVLVLFSIFYFLFSPHAFAAVLFTQSANQDVFETQTFVVNWQIDTEGKSINAIDLTIKFNPETLKALSTSQGNSLVSLWVKNPEIDNNQGTIKLTGGIPNGANGKNVPVISATFEAVKSGIGSISVDPQSEALANDGFGTVIPLKFVPVSFTVQPKNFIPNQISSPTHPDQNRWYTNSNVVINFSPKSGTDYSFSFSSNIDVIPEDKVATPESQFSYSNLPDGIYYFKVSSKVGPSKWTEAGVYRIQIDSTRPEIFQPAIGTDASVFNGESFLSFSTVDKMSGISHYMVKAGLLSGYKNQTSPYRLARPIIGDTVTIRAIDNAGNVREQSIPYKGYLSVKVFETAVIILILLGLVSFIWLRRKKRTS